MRPGLREWVGGGEIGRVIGWGIYACIYGYNQIYNGIKIQALSIGITTGWRSD
jgi:hypothetical protein